MSSQCSANRFWNASTKLRSASWRCFSPSEERENIESDWLTLQLAVHKELEVLDYSRNQFLVEVGSTKNQFLPGSALLSVFSRVSAKKKPIFLYCKAPTGAYHMANIQHSGDDSRPHELQFENCIACMIKQCKKTELPKMLLV